MQILRRSGYKTVPWKNGGGVTHEVIRRPADAERFDWRVSVAQIAQPGPFSDFSGYTRFMVLLAGGGVRLRSAGSDDLLLRQPGELIRFPGSLALQCDLLQGECTDLNLMVCDRTMQAEAGIHTLPASGIAAAARADLRFLFCVRGGVILDVGGGPQTLNAWDSCILGAGQGDVRCLPATTDAAAADPTLLFIADLSRLA